MYNLSLRRMLFQNTYVFRRRVLLAKPKPNMVKLKPIIRAQDCHRFELRIYHQKFLSLFGWQNGNFHFEE